MGRPWPRLAIVALYGAAIGFNMPALDALRYLLCQKPSAFWPGGIDTAHIASRVQDVRGDQPVEAAGRVPLVVRLAFEVELAGGDEAEVRVFAPAEVGEELGHVGEQKQAPIGRQERPEQGEFFRQGRPA